MSPDAPSPDPACPFDALPPALRTEVIGRIRRYAAMGAVGVLGLVAVLVVLVGPTPHVAGTLGVALLMAFLLYLAAWVGMVAVMAIPLGFWVGFLSDRRLGELYGLDRAQLRPVKPFQIREAWPTSLAGLAVGGGFAGAIALIQAAVTGKPGSIGPLMMVAASGAGLATRAWTVRRAVALARSTAEPRPRPEPLDALA